MGSRFRDALLAAHLLPMRVLFFNEGNLGALAAWSRARRGQTAARRLSTMRTSSIEIARRPNSSAG